MAELASGATGRRSLQAFSGLLLTTVFWGSAVPFSAILLRDLDPFLLAALRMVLSVAALAAFVSWRERTDILHIPLTWRRFLTLGFFMAGFNVFFTLSILWSNPITVAAIMVSMPLIGSLTAKALAGTTLERGFVPALLLSIAGGMLVVHGQPGFDATRVGLRGGELLMLVAMVSWNVYSIKAQSWLASVGQSRLTLISSYSTALWLVGVFVVMALLGVAHLPAALPSVETTSMLIYLAVFSAAVGNSLWNFGVSVVGVPIASLYVNLTPVFAVLIGVLFGIYPTVEQVAGGLVVMAGVLYMQLRKMRSAPAV